MLAVWANPFCLHHLAPCMPKDVSVSCMVGPILKALSVVIISVAPYANHHCVSGQGRHCDNDE